MLIDCIQLILISRQSNLKVPLEKCPVGLEQNNNVWGEKNALNLVYQQMIKFTPIVYQPHNIPPDVPL